MTRYEKRVGVSKEQEAILWAELNRAVNELGKFDVFSSSEARPIPKEALPAVFKFAAAYGRCVFAGLNLDWQNYFRAEISPRVALAIAEAMQSEISLLTAFSQSAGFAKKIFHQYIDIAAACVANQEAMELHERWVDEFVPLHERESVRLGSRLLHEGHSAKRLYQIARNIASKRAFAIRDYIREDLDQ